MRVTIKNEINPMQYALLYFIVKLLYKNFIQEYSYFNIRTIN
jgi:hypothetical protein